MNRDRASRRLDSRLAEYYGNKAGMNKKHLSRKFVVTMFAMVGAQASLLLDKIDGNLYSGLITLCVGVYAAANYGARRLESQNGKAGQ